MSHVLRLFIENDLHTGEEIVLSGNSAHYVSKVMRGRIGTIIRLFNGKDGEWQSEIGQIERRQVVLQVQGKLRPQTICPDIELVFSPVKRTRQEFIVEKATELGVRNMQIVNTKFSNQKPARSERLQTIIVEAAEQTERMDLPKIAEIVDLKDWLLEFPTDRVLVFCDESGTDTAPILAALNNNPTKATSVLIGPEGGFSKQERELIAQTPGALAVSLGPRILRSDTAAVAALAMVQAVYGDWK
ncbi:MAG: 16S rRNA (uracil(1498)-N(3))-methyltransferase [Robiginitomaculum sp.]|nr:16S rRNA (uracil(1498)-N(3))-methyltransferase [Robiginitomaculum sp.]